MRHVATLREKANRIVVGALAVAIALYSTAAMGTPMRSIERTSSGAPFVTLDKGAVSTPVAGAFAFKIDVVVDAPTSYLESRIQIRNPGGRLLYQKTEVRSDVPTGTMRFEYARDLADLKLQPGTYPIELRVRSQSGGVQEWVIHDELLLYDPAGPSVPVAIVVKIEAIPSMDAEGRFVIDPAQSTQARDEAAALARLIIDNPALRLTLAVPPLILEEWLRASQGYSIAGIEGVVEVPADAPAPKAYAEVLELLKRALATGRLELLDVPYSQPDIGALQSSERVEDLTEQLRRGHSATFAALESSPSAGIATSSNLVPAEAADVLGASGVRIALVDIASIESSDTTPASGAYRAENANALTAMVSDSELSAALESAGASSCVSAVFQRSISESPTMPMVAEVITGPGYEASISSLAECLAELEQAPWATFTTVTQAAGIQTDHTVELAATVPEIEDAPAGFWEEASKARQLASAFLGAVGVNDPEAQTASSQSLVAQSALWAGPDLKWSSADRGRAIAAASIRGSRSVLDAIVLGASEITLSGTTGDVPISITNSSDKTLALQIRTQASGMDVPPRDDDMLEIRPQENFATVPVDLGQSLAGELTTELWADDVLVDQITVAVRASFLDRLVLVGGLVIVLVGMLLFIRHRVRSAARADTI